MLTKVLPVSQITISSRYIYNYNDIREETVTTLMNNPSLIHTNPIKVNRIGDVYYLLAGQHRLTACKKLSEIDGTNKHIKAYVYDNLSDEDSWKLSFHDNQGHSDSITNLTSYISRLYINGNSINYISYSMGSEYSETKVVRYIKLTAFLDPTVCSMVKTRGINTHIAFNIAEMIYKCRPDMHVLIYNKIILVKASYRKTEMEKYINLYSRETKLPRINKVKCSNLVKELILTNYKDITSFETSIESNANILDMKCDITNVIQPIQFVSSTTQPLIPSLDKFRHIGEFNTDTFFADLYHMTSALSKSIVPVSQDCEGIHKYIKHFYYKYNI